jgi:hypothetical protein
VQYEPLPIGQALGAVGGQVIVPAPPHVPAWQVTPIGHPRPQAPQFAGSVAGSAQYEPPAAAGQLIGAVAGQPIGVVPLQLPPMQAMPVGHRLPQTPQLPASFCTLVQNSPPGPKQPFGVGPPHTSDAPPPHDPFWQITPGGQTTPQFPQLFGSPSVSVQIVPVGDGHILGLSGVQVVPPPVPHIPAWHMTPG